jgi:hypothetical protein
MRRFLACLVTALALPAAAGATSMPPLHGVHPGARFVPAETQHRNASCSEQGRSTKAARLTRKLAPVACEQPPRPKLVNSLSGSFFGR